MVLETQPTTQVSEAVDLRGKSTVTIFPARLIPNDILNLLLIPTDKCSSRPFVFLFSKQIEIILKKITTDTLQRSIGHAEPSHKRYIFHSTPEPKA